MHDDDPAHEPTAAPGPRDSSSVRHSVLGPGDLIGGYRLEEIVGVGGMGVVFRAHEQSLGRTVAVKLIAPEHSADARFRELFLQELQVAAVLEHPNILPVFSAGHDGDHLYVAMRLVRGPSLRQILGTAGRLAPARAARIVAQVAAALDAAHARGLLHRDVKPANILIAGIGDEEHVYLADFGLAGRGRLPPGSGTDGYRAPEHLTGAPVSAAADTYALGRVLVACLSGRPETPAGERADDLPVGFAGVIGRATADRAEDRFPTAGEFAAALMALRYDAVLVASPADAALGRELCAALTRGNLDARLADENPGDALELAGACGLLVGADGLGSWSRPALAAVGRIAVRDRQFRRMAILLPGAPPPDDATLAALRTWNFVDLRDEPDDAQSALVRAIRGPSFGVLGEPSARCPYRGLESFDEDDADIFVGREDDVARLVGHLEKTRFVAILGPSGSGKSSVVTSGLVPAIRRDAFPGSGRWPITVARPGADPLRALSQAAVRLGADAIPDLATDPTGLDAGLQAIRGDRAMLVIDQFEEVFTLTVDADARRAAIDAIVYAATVPAGRLVVVLAMRADFYPRLAEHEALRTLVGRHQYLLGPMRASHLRRAIEEPARRAGLTIEPGLTRTLIEDVDDRPGALPLLSHVLFELWRRRRGNELTLEGYAATGGVDGALARRADEVVEALGPEREATVRQVMLRLTRPGEGTEDTRRRVALTELGGRGADAAATSEVVAALSKARLLTTGVTPGGSDPTVEMAHEALVRSWPRLRRWIDDDREGLRLHRRLSDATAEWDRSGRDESHLLRGAQLAAWQERDWSEVSQNEVAFLAESHQLADRETSARRRRTRIVVAGLSAGLVALGALATTAVVQRRAANADRDRALSRQIAGSARETLASDPELSSLLARRAFEVGPTREAEEILRQSAFTSLMRTAHPAPRSGALEDVIFTGSGEAASAYSNGSIAVWGLHDNRDRLVLRGHDGPVTGLAMAQRASQILSVGDDGTLRRWQLASGRGERVADVGAPLTALSVSPRAGTAAVGATDGRVRVIDLTTGQTRRILVGLNGRVNAVAISPDGATVLGGDEQGELRRWTATRSDVVRPADQEIAVADVAISPNGRQMAYATAIGVMAGPLDGRPRATNTSTEARSVRFDASGDLLVAGDVNGTARVLDAATLTTRAVLRGSRGVLSAAVFDASSRAVLTGSGDGNARVWAWGAASSDEVVVPVDDYVPAGQPVERADGSIVAMLGSGRTAVWRPPAATFAPEGRRLVQPAAGYAIDVAGRRGVIGLVDGTVVLRDIWSSRDRRLVTGTGTFSNAAFVRQLAIGRTRVVAGRAQSDLMEWDLSTGERFAFGHRHPLITAAALSADQVRVATGGDDGIVRVWRFGDRTPEREIPGHEGTVASVAFSPDGTLVASGGEDRSVRVRTLDGAVVSRLQGLATKVNGVAFSAEGSPISIGTDSGIIVWDWRRNVILTRLPAPEATYAASLTNPERIVSFGADNLSVLRRWRCATCALLDRALAAGRAGVTRELTVDEKVTFNTE